MSHRLLFEFILSPGNICFLAQSLKAKIPASVTVKVKVLISFHSEIFSLES